MVINKINFPIYGIIVFSSIAIGMIYVYRMLRKENIESRNILLYFIMYISFTLSFAKLYTMYTSPTKVNIINAGLSSYGAAVGIILSAYIFEKILPTGNKILKYSIISLPLIYGLSKIACFIVGCCYGIPYNGLFSVTYTHGLNIALFPVQITETIVFIILFIILNKLRNNKNIIYMTIITGVLAKFLLDFLRYDHLNKIITTNQLFSIILLLVVIIVFILKRIKKLT